MAETTVTDAMSTEVTGVTEANSETTSSTVLTMTEVEITQSPDPVDRRESLHSDMCHEKVVIETEAVIAVNDTNSVANEKNQGEILLSESYNVDKETVKVDFGFTEQTEAPVETVLVSIQEKPLETTENGSTNVHEPSEETILVVTETDTTLQEGTVTDQQVPTVEEQAETPEVEKEIEMVRSQHGPCMEPTIPVAADDLVIHTEASPQTPEVPHFIMSQREPSLDTNASKEHVEVVEQQEVVDEPDLATDQQQQEVKPNGALTESQSRPTSVALSEQTGEVKHKHRFHFHLKRSKESKSKDRSKKDSPTEDVSSHKFAENVRNIFGTLRRGLRTKHQKHEQPVTAEHITRPPRPPIWKEGTGANRLNRMHSSLSEMDQQSLQSISGPSISSSPEVHKRRLIQQALPDFIAALPPDSPDAMVVTNGDVMKQPSEDAARQEAVLAWTASQIARGSPPTNRVALTGLMVIQEDNIKPTTIQRSISPLSNASTSARYPSTVSALKTGSPPSLRGTKAGLPPRPPRPQSPPLLSPLDYQAFHSEDSTVHPDVINQRMTMMQMMHPTEGSIHSDAYANTAPYRPIQANVSHTQYENQQLAASMELYQQNQYAQGSPQVARRTQTLRTDYANRVRERVRSLRAESPEGRNAGTMRPLQMRGKKENYVCSDTITLPKISTVLKRRKTVPPKTVQPCVNEPVVPRPQTCLMSAHPTGMLQRPLPPNISPDYIIMTQTDAMQAVAPMRLGRGEIQSNELHMVPSANQPKRQLTSLRSVRAHQALQQSTFVMDSPLQGMVHVAQGAAVQSFQEALSTSLPYFSEGLVDQLACPEIEAAPAIRDDVKSGALSDALKMAQPYLHALDTSDHVTGVTTESGESTQPNAEPQLSETVRAASQNFLTACVRLRSMDLQGQFAPFHYPLPSFDPRMWKRCARLAEWDDLQVLREPEWNTEYAQLKPPTAPHPKLLYSERPIDSMLTHWLDCRHTAPQGAQMTSVCGLTQSPACTAIYHSILFASDLASLLTLTPYKDTNANAICHDCLRLAVLLSYHDCCTSCRDSELDTPTTNPADILIIVSVSNCLVMFRAIRKEDTPAEPLLEASAKEEEEAPAQPVTETTTDSDVDQMPAEQPVTPEKTHPLVQSLCPTYKTVDEAIDGLVDKIHRLSIGCFNESAVVPALIKAIAPPDWIAMLLARLHLAKA